MQKYILVPLDGSTLSEAILPHAVAVAQATKSALLLLQVLEPVFAEQALDQASELASAMDATFHLHTFCRFIFIRKTNLNR